MPIKEPIRIISDLHIGLSATALEKPEQLAPLFEGMGSVIFNGDTVETRFPESQEKAKRDADALANMCCQRGAQPFFINGNHDPAISELNHADLCDGAVLLTHGDMLFHDISPWCEKNAHVMGAAHTKVLEKFEDEAFHDFEKRLDASKHAAQSVELKDLHLPHGRLAQLLFVLGQGWPPSRPVKIIQCWLETPGRAVALARVFRPRARIIVIGHTHRAGIWRMGPRVVINTGSFLRFANRFAVDINAGTVVVRKIVNKNGQFVIGQEVGRFDATKLKAHEGF